MVTAKKAAKASSSCLPWPVKATPCTHYALPTGIEELDRFVGGIPNHGVMALMATKKNKIWALEVSQKIVETNAEHLFGNAEEKGMHLACFQEELSLNEMLSLKDFVAEKNCCAVFNCQYESSELSLGHTYEMLKSLTGKGPATRLSKIIKNVHLLVVVEEMREPRNATEHELQRDGVPDPNGKTLRLNLVKTFEDRRHFFVKKSDL